MDGRLRGCLMVVDGGTMGALARLNTSLEMYRVTPWTEPDMDKKSQPPAARVLFVSPRITDQELGT